MGTPAVFHQAANSVSLHISSTFHMVIESSSPGVFSYALTGPGIDGGILAGTATDSVLKLADGYAGFYMSAANDAPRFDNLSIATLPATSPRKRFRH